MEKYLSMDCEIFTEHRLFQLLQPAHKVGIFDFSHRFMLEQRFAGGCSSANVKSEDEFS